MNKMIRGQEQMPSQGETEKDEFFILRKREFGWEVVGGRHFIDF